MLLRSWDIGENLSHGSYFCKIQDGGHTGIRANVNIVFLIPYSIKFPKMYSFDTLHKNPAKVKIQTLWTWLTMWRIYSIRAVKSWKSPALFAMHHPPYLWNLSFVMSTSSCSLAWHLVAHFTSLIWQSTGITPRTFRFNLNSQILSSRLSGSIRTTFTDLWPDLLATVLETTL